jgi:predicted DNA-binding antitoxin AbrB/MazE fold protein
MSQKVKAIYRNGAFLPQSSYSLPNNTEVELVIKCCSGLHTDIVDPETRKEILKTLLQRMRQRNNS